MNKESIVLLTKDAQCKSYYPCYGNKYYAGKTPNMDELCAKGTKFDNCYTVAPSSAMSYLGMFTGKYPYELEMKEYVHLDHDFDGDTLFDKANKLGYETHVLWDEHWYEMAYVYSRCYGRNTEIHYFKNLRQGVGPQYKRNGHLQRNDDVAKETLERFRAELANITSVDNKQFVWIHLPHVLNGRTGYADDVDLYDMYIGVVREFFDDSNIFISADHGNMNGMRGKLRYGFDVYEPAINIPLITPRINNLTECYDNIVNKDFFDLIFTRTIKPQEYIIVDSTYYAQPRRKTAVIWKNFRYIYNKEPKTEELYDVGWDPVQQYNIMGDYFHDVDRNNDCLSSELYFYPYWETLPDIRDLMRKKIKDIWREPSNKEKCFRLIKDRFRRNKLARAVFLPVKNIFKK